MVDDESPTPNPDVPPPSPVSADDPTVIGRGPQPDEELTIMGRGPRPGPHSFLMGGNRLGPYEILQLLGRGGQGEVYLAEDSRLSRRVALKILPPQYSHNPAVKARFHREAELSSKLDHPGICTIFDFGEADGLAYIAMRYVEGDSLARKIAKARDNDDPEAGAACVPLLDETQVDSEPHSSRGPRRRASDDALLLVQRCAEALHVAHEAGLVHRDIKPANIMVASDGRPVVLDFGLARDLGDDSVGLTMTGDMLGTPTYMSPEQMKGVSVDRRTDLFSLGVVLYECVTTKRPFRGMTLEALRKEILEEKPRDPRKLNHTLPDDLAKVLEVALDKDPKRRYQTAKDFAEDLRRVRQLQPILARPAGRLLRFRRWAQRNPVLAASLSLIFLSLLGGLLMTVHFLKASREQARILDASLEETRRLSDINLVRILTEEAERLPSIAATSIGPYEAWLGRAEDLYARAEGHRVRLNALRDTALPYDEAAQQRDYGSHRDARKLQLRRTRLEAIEGIIDRMFRGNAPEKEIEKMEDYRGDFEAETERIAKEVESRRLWEFEDDTQRWEHDTLTDLVKRLDSFAEDSERRTGPLARVRIWFDQSKKLFREFAADKRSRWDAVVADIADQEASPAYGGMHLEAQADLVPLGKDPESGLHEFVHILSGDVPERDGRNRLVLEESTGVVFVLIPAQTFVMGAAPPSSVIKTVGPNIDPAALRNEGPPHEVTLSAYFVGKYEMTQSQWRRIAGFNPSWFTAQRFPQFSIDGLHPLENVSWFDASRELATAGLALPTEAQWECAARAGTSTVFFTGDLVESLEGYANVYDQQAANKGFRVDGTEAVIDFDDRSAFHAKVGSYGANPWGLHDVHGNVDEWTSDLNANYFQVKHIAGTGAFAHSNSEYRTARGEAGPMGQVDCAHQRDPGERRNQWQRHRSPCGKELTALTEIRIRHARRADVDPMLAIYAPIVRETAISFEYEAPDLAAFTERLLRTQEGWPWLVAESDELLLGYAYATAFRARPAYARAAEVAIYVAPSAKRMGVGRQLYEGLLTDLKSRGFVMAYAGIALPNSVSVAFHEDLGFKPVGVFHRAGFKFDAWHDVGFWERPLD